MLTGALTMWIRTESNGTKRLKDPALGIDIQFSRRQRAAQVTEDVGAKLMKQYGQLRRHDAGNPGDGADDEDDNQ